MNEARRPAAACCGLLRLVAACCGLLRLVVPCCGLLRLVAACFVLCDIACRMHDVVRRCIPLLHTVIAYRSLLHDTPRHFAPFRRTGVEARRLIAPYCTVLRANAPRALHDIAPIAPFGHSEGGLISVAAAAAGGGGCGSGGGGCGCGSGGGGGGGESSPPPHQPLRALATAPFPSFKGVLSGVLSEFAMQPSRGGPGSPAIADRNIAQ